jgi:hypothetical protein
MGFMRLTPLNAKATHAAGATTFVLGGAAIFLFGALALALAAAQVVEFAWEQAALAVLGAIIAIIGRTVSGSRRSLD